MPEELPKGWVKTTLGEIVQPSRERVLPAEVPGMRYVGLEHIEPKTMRLLGHGYASEVHSSSMFFSKGDVLYGKMRPYLNKVWVAEFDGICSAELLVFPELDGLNSQFLAMRLNAKDFVNFANDQISGERPRVKFEKLSNFPILLPPLTEQARIIAKLEAAIAGLARAEKAGRRAQERLQHYRAAVLQAAATGELTRGWRGTQRKKETANSETGNALLQRLLASRRLCWEEVEVKRLNTSGKAPKNDNWKARYPEPSAPNIAGLPELPEGWTWASPGQLSSGRKYALAIGPFGSNLKVSDYRDSGVPLIFVRNIRKAVFSGKSTHSISQRKAQELNAHQAKGGDILIAKMGDPPGDACLYPEDAPTAVITADCIRMQISPLLNNVKSVFVHFINSKHVRDQIRQITMGVAQQKISLSRFASIALPLPPLTEQTEIIREVEHRLSAADRLEDVLVQQFDRSLAARQTLLAEAFLGHLVPQDPKDEPVAVLLDRIRAVSKTETNKPKGKHMAKSQTQKNASRRPLLSVLRKNENPMTPKELFLAAGYGQESVDDFFAELRKLTEKPAKIVEERGAAGQRLLRVTQ